MDKVTELQNRIDELEVYKGIAIALQTPEHNNKIKAEGVREMIKELDLYNPPTFFGVPRDLYEYINEYADKLEKGE